MRPGWLSPIMAPVLRFVFMRETQKRLGALKAYLERAREVDTPL